MIKILHVIHGLNLGGAENFIYNLLGAINHDMFRFDFAVQEPEIKHTKFKELIVKAGCTIHIIPDFVRNPIGHAIHLRKIINSGYDYVHIHMNAFINPIPAIVASKGNCKVIIHSHSTSNGKGGFVGKLIHYINKSLFIKKYFIRLSCSEAAGRWMFGEKSSVVICNAINPEEYSYNGDIRRQIRASLDINDGLVIGQIGRLIPLKNQAFSINLLKTIREQVPELDVRLVLIGDGPQKEELELLAEQLDIRKYVIFTGNVHNANEYYSAFDTFILPSLIEGLAFVAVEAQANGLKTIVADTLPHELDITNSVSFISLNKPDEWVIQLIENAKEYDRHTIADKVKGSPFDVNVMVKTMEHIYSSNN